MLITLILVTGFTATFAFMTLAQPSEEEAKSAFENLGCVSCHNGTVALSWEDIVALMKEVPTKYNGDVDALAQDVAYFGQKGAFQTWDQLMQVMAQNVGKTLDDPQVQVINQYLLSLAGVTPGEETGAPPEETTPAETPEETPAEGVPGEEEAPPGIPFGLAAVLALLIVALIAAAAYMFARK